MLTRCLSCYRDFPAAAALDQPPFGRSFAFDPERGRLWLICKECQRWSLMPLEARWEQIEQLERLVRDQARLLAQTANIALFAARGLSIIRVGRARGREEAWWRYGTELRQRQARSEKILFRGKVIDALVATMLVGFPIWGYRNAGKRLERAAERRLGTHLIPRNSHCRNCGHRLFNVYFSERNELRIEGGDGELAVRVPCYRCRVTGGAIMTGAAAEHVLGRALAFENFAGATETHLEHAVAVVEGAATPRALLDRTAARRIPFGAIDKPGKLALEIALHDAVEREWLELEVKELEARWREEEMLAGIVDRELT